MRSVRESTHELRLTGPASDGRTVFKPVRRSRRRVMAATLATILILGPMIFAAARYIELRDDNEAMTVSVVEGLVVSEGTSKAEREGEEFPASAADEDGALIVDLGELAGGSSRVFDDLLVFTNTGEEPLTVYVETSGISEPPLHATPNGEEAPGAFWLEPGEEESLALALAVDLAALPQEVEGEIVFRTASGLTTYTVPARATVTNPPAEKVMAALTGAIENPRSGLGRLTDVSAGLETPDFEVEGVQDGGAYGHDVTITWRPVGPLTGVRATVNGRAIGSPVTVVEEGEHLLRLEGRVLGTTLFSKEIGFRIDKTAPEVIVVSPPLVPAERTKFLMKITDESPIVSVHVVLVPQQAEPEEEPPAEEPEESPEPEKTPAPRQSAQSASGSGSEQEASSTQQSEANEDEESSAEETETEGSASPSPSPSSSPEAEPSSSPAPKPTASPTPKPTASPTPAPRTSGSGQSEAEDVGSEVDEDESEAPEPIRLRAYYHPVMGLWAAEGAIPAGRYLVHVEAVDIIGNTQHTEPQPLEAVSVIPSSSQPLGFLRRD